MIAAFENFEKRLKAEESLEGQVAGAADSFLKSRGLTPISPEDNPEQPKPVKKKPGRPKLQGAKDAELDGAAVGLNIRLPADIFRQSEILTEALGVTRPNFCRAVFVAGLAAIIRHLESGSAGVSLPLRFAVLEPTEPVPCYRLRSVSADRMEDCSELWNPRGLKSWRARRKRLGLPDEPAHSPPIAHYTSKRGHCGKWTFTTPIGHGLDFPSQRHCEAAIASQLSHDFAAARNPQKTADNVLAAYFETRPTL